MSAQVTVRGIVSDTAHHPLDFATIIVKGDSGIVANAVTDSIGHYQFRIMPGVAYKIEVSHLGAGNQHAQFSSKGDTTINFYLAITSHELKEIVVGGRRALERKADRFIFTPDKIMAAGASGIDIMQHVPLLMYDQRSGSLSIIGKANTVVYINNRKTQIPAQMLLQYLQALPAENIRNVEIITNPGGEYNAATSGGVININLRRMLDEGWQGSAVVETHQGYYNRSDLNGFLNYRKGKVGLQLTPSFSNNYNFGTDTSQMVYKTGQQQDILTRSFRRYRVYGTGATLDYDIDNHNQLSYQGWIAGVSGKSQATSNTAYSTAGAGEIDSLQQMNTTGKDHYIYNFGNLNYHHTFNNNGDQYLDANIDYNQFTQTQKNNWDINQGAIGKYYSDLPQKFFNLSERLEFATKLPGDIRLLVGSQYSATTVNNDVRYYTWAGESFVNDETQSENYHYTEKYLAGFFSLSKSIGKLSLKGGLRLEHTDYLTEARLSGEKADSNYLNLFPTGALSYHLNDNHQFSLSYSRKINRPNSSMLFMGKSYTSQNYYSQNNPYLQPALSDNVEFSYLLKSKYVLNATYTDTRNDFNFFIIPVTEDGVSKLKRTSYNYGYVQSLNFTINFHDYIVKDVWELYVTPSYTYSRYKGTSNEVPVSITNSSFEALIDNYLYISRKKMWTAFVTFGYNSPYKNISRERLNERTSLDLMVKKVVKPFTFYLAVYDVFNGGSVQRYDLYKNALLTRNITNANVYNRSAEFKIRYSFGNGYLHKNRERNTANEDVRKRIGQ